MKQSQLYSKYSETIDPVSAYEMLTDRINKNQAQQNEEKLAEEQELESKTTKKQEKSVFEQVIAAPITRQIGREIVRGIFGMLTGKKTRSKSGGLFGF